MNDKVVRLEKFNKQVLCKNQNMWSTVHLQIILAALWRLISCSKSKTIWQIMKFRRFYRLIKFITMARIANLSDFRSHKFTLSTNSNHILLKKVIISCIAMNWSRALARGLLAKFTNATTTNEVSFYLSRQITCRPENSQVQLKVLITGQKLNIDFNPY